MTHLVADEAVIAILTTMQCAIDQSISVLLKLQSSGEKRKVNNTHVMQICAILCNTDAVLQGYVSCAIDNYSRLEQIALAKLFTGALTP